MTNKYANLVGTNPIKDEYTKINTGFDGVEQDVAAIEADVTVLEAEMQDNQTQTADIIHGLQKITTDQATSLVPRFFGRTVINYAPLFDSGLWTFDANVTVDSATKITLNAPSTANEISGLILPFADGTYTISNKGTGRVLIYKQNGAGALVGGVTGEGSFTFTVDSTYNGEVYINLDNGNTAGTFTFENIMLNKGSEAKEFVANVKPVKNPVLVSYGKNLFDGRLESGYWDSSGNKVANSSYVRTPSYIKVLPNTDYVWSREDGLDLGDSTLTWFDSDKNRISAISSLSHGTSVSGTSPSNAEYVTFHIASTDTSLAMQLELGTVATAYTKYNQDYLYVLTSIGSNEDGTVQDEIYRQDGQWWMLERIEKLVLDGSLPWTYDTDFAGHKTVKLVVGSTPITASESSASVVKYDGKILKYNKAASSPDEFVLYGSGDGSLSNGLFIAIPDDDSGWGDSYTPTGDEIKAYFYGWKMYTDGGSATDPYNGTGTKAWAKINLESGGYNEGQTTLPTTLNTSYDYVPYSLSYQLAEPQTIPVTVEGATTGLTLAKGDNQVELLEGVIDREPVTPKLLSANGRYYINSGSVLSSSIPDGGEFDFRSKKILKIFAGSDDVTDLAVKFENTGAILDAYGEESAYFEGADFDETKQYYATYLPLDTYAITAPIASAEGTYTTSLKSRVDANTRDIADVATGLSIVKLTYAKKGQMNWIEPTLLNGWVNEGGVWHLLGYRKDEFGNVYIRGFIKSGTTAVGTIIFKLPSGYRPSKRVRLDTTSWDGTNEVHASLDIWSNGDVVVAEVTNNALSMQLKPFSVD